MIRRSPAEPGFHHPVQPAGTRTRPKEDHVTEIEALNLQNVFLLLGRPGSPELAALGTDDHDPEFEPYCSMSRGRIAESWIRPSVPATYGNGPCSWSSSRTTWIRMS